MTVHIPLPTSTSKSTLYKSLLALHKLVTNSPDLASRADIHLVISPFPRAFNTWRNLARLFARTLYILLLDVDFAICTDWRASVSVLLRDGENELGRRVRGGIAALVLPAFEYVKQAEGRNQAVFPRDKNVRTVLSPASLLQIIFLIDPRSGAVGSCAYKSGRSVPRNVFCRPQQYRLPPILCRQARRGIQSHTVPGRIRAIRGSQKGRRRLVRFAFSSGL